MFWAAYENKDGNTLSYTDCCFRAAREINMETRLDRQTDVLGAHIHTHTYIN